MVVRVLQLTSPICGSFSEKKRNLTKNSVTIEIGTLTSFQNTLCMVANLLKFFLKPEFPSTFNGSVSYFLHSHRWDLCPAVQIRRFLLKGGNENLQSTSYSQGSFGFWFDGAFRKKTLSKVPLSHAKLWGRQLKNLWRN